MTELEPCPFCGGKAEVRYSEPTERFAVVCTKCRAQTRAWFAGKHGDEYAIKDWNSRYNEVKPTKIDPSRCKFGYDECIEVSYRGHTLCHLCGEERTGITEEPKTCHNVSQHGFFECSQCGASIVADSCGEFSPDIWVENGQLNYCPNCGARVEARNGQVKPTGTETKVTPIEVMRMKLGDEPLDPKVREWAAKIYDERIWLDSVMEKRDGTDGVPSIY